MSPEELTAVHWPGQWKPLFEGADSLLPTIIPGEATTILQELHQEICESHPLWGVECVPIAYEWQQCKDYLLETDREDFPIVLVHLTFTKESDPHYPFIIRFRDIGHFVALERYRDKKWWQFWIREPRPWTAISN